MCEMNLCPKTRDCEITSVQSWLGSCKQWVNIYNNQTSLIIIITQAIMQYNWCKSKTMIWHGHGNVTPHNLAIITSVITSRKTIIVVLMWIIELWHCFWILIWLDQFTVDRTFKLILFSFQYNLLSYSYPHFVFLNGNSHRPFLQVGWWQFDGMKWSPASSKSSSESTVYR